MQSLNPRTVPNPFLFQYMSSQSTYCSAMFLYKKIFSFVTSFDFIVSFSKIFPICFVVVGRDDESQAAAETDLNNFNGICCLKSLFNWNFIQINVLKLLRAPYRSRICYTTYKYFLLFEKEGKKKRPETFSLVRDIQHTPYEKPSNRYTFISFYFLVGSEQCTIYLHENAKHEKIMEQKTILRRSRDFSMLQHEPIRWFRQYSLLRSWSRLT